MSKKFSLHKFPLNKSKKTVLPKPSFPKIEEDILKYWDENDICSKSLNANKNTGKEFVFYDGPPFANGLPHYGHLLTGFVKDLIPRYKTMKGFYVPRRFGWDCHGMPAEYEAEKILKIHDKQDIEDIGIAKFNDICKKSVLKYTKEWRDYVKRQARWVDFDGGYKTLDKSFMESVMWAFKELWNKELIYKGFRVLWYCVHCETPLSATETKMDEAYKLRQDTAITVPFELENGLIALAWTTTPWTLPSNLALAVNPKMKYVVISKNEKKYVLAQSRIKAYTKELGNEPKIVQKLMGNDLLGIKYKPIFDYFFSKRGKGGELENAYKIISANYVSEDDGTGIVHTAPGFGEDDNIAGNENNIGIVVPVDDSGKFTNEIKDEELQGKLVFNSNKLIIDKLKAQGEIFKIASFEHNYPHCWRCSTPLIQKAVSSWFVDVPKIVKRMTETNQDIAWIPSHLKNGQFGHWIANAKDWSISRNRYWGSPIPVWESDNPKYPRTDVYGSIKDVENDFGVKVTDLHIPYIDNLTRVNPDDPSGKSNMRRVPEVLDCWFESGSMPYASVHYPFTNKDWFPKHFPADFIVEYIGQTRGWFYTLHVLATALFDKEAFSTCLSHGIVLGNDGQKMSKTLMNYPDVNEVYNRDGADAMRWFLMSSSILRGGNLIVTNDGIRDSVRKNLLPLWNAYSFFVLYYNSAKKPINLEKFLTSEQKKDVLDEYILAKTNNLIKDLTKKLDEYQISESYETVSEFLDILNNWYIRGSRQRFWNENITAFNTLYTVLVTVAKLLAPLAPFLAEEIYRGLTNDESVHLKNYPEFSTKYENDNLVETMDRVREICSIGLSIRKKNKIRVRQPLSKITIVDNNISKLKKFSNLIKNELNVKEVLFMELKNDKSKNIKVQLELKPRILGPRIGSLVQFAIAAAKLGDWTESNGKIKLKTAEGPLDLQKDEWEKIIVASSGVHAGILQKGGYVILDTKLTVELEDEGYVRDLIRKIQETRKETGLDVSDHINLFLDVPKHRVNAIEKHKKTIMNEVLASKIQIDTKITQDEIIKVEKV
jgi:isoleucyl-tRNA synthetase